VFVRMHRCMCGCTGVCGDAQTYVGMHMILKLCTGGGSYLLYLQRVTEIFRLYTRLPSGVPKVQWTSHAKQCSRPLTPSSAVDFSRQAVQ